MVKKLILKVPLRLQHETSLKALGQLLKEWEKNDKSVMVLPDDVEVIVIEDNVKVAKDQIEVHVELDE